MYLSAGDRDDLGVTLDRTDHGAGPGDGECQNQAIRSIVKALKNAKEETEAELSAQIFLLMV